MADGRHLKKIENWPYLRNGLTDWRKIWQADAYWPSALYCHIKFQTFTYPRWRAAAILKNRRTVISRLYNGLTDRREILHCGTYLLWEPYRQLIIWIPKNPRWRTAAILITVKLLYLSNGSTCCRETWYNDTCWPLVILSAVKILSV